MYDDPNYLFDLPTMLPDKICRPSLPTKDLPTKSLPTKVYRQKVYRQKSLLINVLNRQTNKQLCFRYI